VLLLQHTPKHSVAYRFADLALKEEDVMQTKILGSSATKTAGFAALLLVLILAFAAQSMAEGFRNPPEGAAALGRAGGRIAIADDAAAVTHNPANLVELDGSEVQAAVTIVHAEVDYESPLGGTTETREPWKFLPNLYGVQAVEGGNFAYGIGVTTPFGQSTEWDHNGLFRYSAPYYAELRMVEANPVFAARIGDRLSVAAGVSFYWSDLELRQYYPWSTVVGNPMAPDGEARFTGDGQAWGGNVAATLQLTDRQRLAATYRSSFDVDYEGDFRVSNIPGPIASPRSDFDTTIRFPAIAGFGYGFQVNDKLKIGIDAEWIEFSRYDSLSLDVAENNALLGPAANVSQDWNDSWTYGIGVDWQFADDLTLRAGYMYIESPIPDQTMSPTLPDANRSVFSVGLGYKVEGHSLDIAYAYSLFDDRDINNNQNPAYNGDYDIASHLLGVSYGYTF
jgi:long-chain fatty acid transport protein